MRLEELSERDIERMLRIVDSAYFGRDSSALSVWYDWATDSATYHVRNGLFGDRKDMDRLIRGWEEHVD